MLTVDLHTHSIASVHALNTIEELLRVADENGLQGVAITDHCPGIDNTMWLIKNQTKTNFWEENIKGPDIPYFLNLLFRYSPPTSIKTKLFKGIECNILSDGDLATDVPVFLAKHFDIVIASVHPLPSLFVLQDKDQITQRMILAMDEPIDIIGHPFHKSYCPHIEPLILAAVEKDVVLELNNSSLALGKADMDQVRQMLQMAKKYKCRISVSSDAHMSNELGVDNQASQLIKETEFPEDLIVNRTLQSTLDFITHRKKVRENKLKK